MRLTEKVTEMTVRLTPLTKEMTTAITIFFIKVFDHNVLYKISDITNPSHQNTSDQGYLNGKTRDSISKEIGISAGRVSYTIKEWKRRIRVPEIEALRNFATTVKKSGLSMQQCAQGYRLTQLMKGLGIDDDDVDADSYTTVIIRMAIAAA